MAIWTRDVIALAVAVVSTAAPLSSQQQSTAAPMSAATTWRGPKLRVGVMSLAGSALGQTSMAGGMATGGMMGAPGMPPGQMLPGQMAAAPMPVAQAPMPMQGGVQGAVAGAIGSVMPGVAQAGPAMPPMAAGSMAVSPGMTVSIPPPPDFVNGLTEMLTTALIQQNQFVVLERSHMNDVINEQTFAASGRVDPATVAQANKVLGAQALIFGDVTEYSQKQSQVGGNFNLLKKVAGQANATVSRVTAQVSVDLRLVDAATGQVLGAVRGQGKASATGLATQFQAMDRGFGAGGAAQTPLGQASREAIANAVAGVVRGLQSMKWSGRVVDVRGTQVYINAGATFGVSPGMTFEVFRQGDQLVDPDTHQSLGTPDQKIGSISVVTVAPGYSVANIVDGSGFQKADVVRFTGVGAAP